MLLTHESKDWNSSMKASDILRSCADEVERDQTLSLTSIRLLKNLLTVVLEAKGYPGRLNDTEWYLDSLEEKRKEKNNGD